MVIFPLIPKMLNKCEGRVATRVGKDMASHFALSVFDLACRTSLLRRQLLVFFFHFCRKCSIWLKSCQKVEKRRWRGKLEKMHMFTSYRFYISHFFSREKEGKNSWKIPVDLFCPQGGRPLIGWMTNGSSSHDESMIYHFFCQIPPQEKMLEIWAWTRKNYPLECINTASSSKTLKMQEETHSNGVDLLSGSGNKLG